MANETARTLRKRMTPQEVKLWVRLRALRHAQGVRFRRQVPLRGFIVDFACFEARLVIELDGGQHSEGQHALRDQERDALLSSHGFEVLRFWNSEMDHAEDHVMTQIDYALRSRLPQQDERPPSP